MTIPSIKMTHGVDAAAGIAICGNLAGWWQNNVGVIGGTLGVFWLLWQIGFAIYDRFFKK